MWTLFFSRSLAPPGAGRCQSGQVRASVFLLCCDLQDAGGEGQTGPGVPPNVLRWNPVLGVLLGGDHSLGHPLCACVHVRVFMYAACACCARTYVACVTRSRVLCICTCACFAHVCACGSCAFVFHMCVCTYVCDTCVTSGMPGLPCEALGALTLGVRNGQGPMEGGAGGR